jgi:hypothetical protein
MNKSPTVYRNGTFCLHYNRFPHNERIFVDGMVYVKVIFGGRTAELKDQSRRVLSYW